MSLLDAVRAGVKVADKVTKPLQAIVTYKRAAATTNQYGLVVESAAVELRAIVDFTRKMVRTQAGELTMSRATIDLLDIDAVVAATNGEGIDVKDKFTLPDGGAGPILGVSGFVDAGTGHPIATTVTIG